MVGGVTLTYQGGIFQVGERVLPYEYETTIKKEIATVIFYKEGQHLLFLKNRQESRQTKPLKVTPFFSFSFSSMSFLWTTPAFDRVRQEVRNRWNTWMVREF